MSKKTVPKWPLLLAGALLLAPPVRSLTDEEVFRDFRFNLINPGARARALGGAFVSLADDATAAQANPAGLGFLRRPEYFAEVRVVDNAAQSVLTEELLPAGVETFVATGTDLDDGTSLSFLSAVLTKNRWTVGFSRQELLNIKNSTLSSLALTFENTPGVVLAEGSGAIDAEVVNWNVSVGYRVTDRLGVGATLAYSTLDVRSEVTNDIVDTEGILAGEQILEQRPDLQTTIDDDDDDLIYSVGVLYKREKWGVGGVYRHGPDFSVAEEVIPLNDLGSDGIADDVFGVAERLGPSFPNRYSLPDLVAVGGNWKISDRLTVAADVERILYSNLLDGFVPGVNVLTSPDARFTIDDATDFRAGVEYVLSTRSKKIPLLALRGGASTEEASTIRAAFTGAESFATEEVFRGGGRQEHVTVGLGIPLQRYKIDVAADFSETNNEFLVSFIYQGKR